MLKPLFVFIVFTYFFICNAQQTDQQKEALDKAKRAIYLMDNGKIEESLVLLKQAQKLDPDNFTYKYEEAYAYYISQDYNKALAVLSKLEKDPATTERYFQLYGNSYDMIGSSGKAIETYNKGLVKFPNSGMLFLEKGNVFWNKKDYSTALSFYEKGISVDPQFPSNYYRATLIYLSSEYEVWGMIYGEIFMNLERNSKRTSEISKLLFNTYKSQISIKGTDEYGVSFYKGTITLNNASDVSSLKNNFGLFVYEPLLGASLIGIDKISISSLDTIRTRFLKAYFSGNTAKDYPNVLFDYQQKVQQAGHLEAYNYWILMKGEEDAFVVWQNANKEKWEAFVKWFTDNKMLVDDTHKFNSSQYK
jgi:hypothetical protein